MDESTPSIFLVFVDVSSENCYSRKLVDGNGKHFILAATRNYLSFFLTYMPKLHNDLSSKIIFYDLSADNSTRSFKFCEKQRPVNSLTGKISQIITHFTFSGKHTIKKFYQDLSNDHCMFLFLLHLNESGIQYIRKSLGNQNAVSFSRPFLIHFDVCFYCMIHF